MNCQFDDYLTEEERTLREIREDMVMLPWQEKKRDYKLSKIISRKIINQVFSNTPSEFREKINVMKISEISKKISEVVGDYQVVVMNFNDLVYSYETQQRVVYIIGGPMSKKEYFAVVDDRYRVVGVHVPKERKQEILEDKIKTALVSLESYLIKQGCTPNREIMGQLESYLLAQRYNLKKGVDKIKIVATAKHLNNSDEKLLNNGKRLQLKFFRSKECPTHYFLYYHIEAM